MPFRVLCGQFAHETNVFARIPTTVADFRAYVGAVGGENVRRAFAQSNLEINGIERKAAQYGWALTHTVAAWATPSGLVQRAVWDTFALPILQELERSRPDGVILALHGAMAMEDDPDAEGTLLAEIRARIGPDVPVAITLDLHANVTEAMARHASIICAYRTYPHIDQAATAERAADILERAMRGEVRPRVHLARRPMLIGLDEGRTTTANPMTELLARADAIERERPDVLCISIQSGFAAADFPEVGPTVCVTGDGARADCQAIAEAFMDHAWETRHFDSVRYLTPDAAIAEARLILAKPGRGPVVIADYADNPGAGAYGDSTFLLKAMIAHGVANAALGALIDPVGAAQLIAAGEGTEITLEIGGRIEPEYGPPLRVTGTVLKVTDGTYIASGPRWKGTTHRLGPTAVLRVGGVDVVVASNRLQCTELEVFGHAGIEPCMLDVIAVKSMQHFRAAYEPIARAVLICDSGAFASPDVRQIPYRHVRRPIYPLDLD